LRAFLTVYDISNKKIGLLGGSLPHTGAVYPSVEDKIVINMNCSLVAIVFVVAIVIVSAIAAVVYVVSKKCKDKKR
jgi:hypothetical protein